MAKKEAKDAGRAWLLAYEALIASSTLKTSFIRIGLAMP